MFPQLSDIETNIHSKINSRAKQLSETSKLNTWVKAISGAKANSGVGHGMVIQSIQNWQAFDLEANGNTNNASYYGNTNINQPRSGTVGVNLEGKPIDTTTITKDRLLRPSPIITGLEIKEGQDQISRQCTLSIKCFTLGQLEVIQTYFMEPGYTLYIEYGWNTPNLNGPIALNLFGNPTKTDNIISEAAKRGLDYDYLHTLRKKSDGEFDCFLGFIVGGSVSSEGEVFNVSISLRGQPALPTYLQSQHKINKLEKSNEDAKTKDKVANPHKVDTYDSSELEDLGKADKTDKAKQRWKYMFNELPTPRQIKEVKQLEELNDPIVSLTHFINFDKTIENNLLNYVDPSFSSRAIDVLTLDFTDADSVTVKSQNGYTAEIDRKDLFSDYKYIKMDLAIKILNSNSQIEGYNVGGKLVSVKIQIDDSVIGAFPYMFSTNPSKLIIPGEMPDFMAYFLNANDIIQGSTGGTKENPILYAENLVVNNTVITPIDNSINGVSFAESEDYEGKYYQKAKYWGYLKNLYVNFEMFKSKLLQSGKTIGEVLLDILNEMSTAVNGYWNFQIVEGKDKNGNIILTIIDENFIGRPNGGSRKSFWHSGIESPFLESSLDLSIPAEMANKIILSRLSYSSNPDSQFASVGSFFNATTDLFLESVKSSNVNNVNETPKDEEQPEESSSDVKQRKAKEEYDAANNTISDLKKNNKFVEIIDQEGMETGVYEFENKAVNEKYKEQIKIQQKAESDYTAAGGEGSLYNVVTRNNQTKAKNTASENLKKISVVPNPEEPIITTENINKALSNVETIKKYFKAYCLRDTAYFDVLKQNAFADRRKTKDFNLSQPLPITYTFKTLGVSGMRRGDMFIINGIPNKYKNNGVFQITELEQNVQDSLWTTSVTGKYRQFTHET